MNSEESSPASVMPFPPDPQTGLSTAPMQVNDTMQNLQNQSFNNPDLGQLPPSPLNANAETFGNSTPSPIINQTNNPTSSDIGNLTQAAMTVLPFLGPEGMAAKLALGAGGGLLFGLLSGADPGQLTADTLAGTGLMGGVGLLSEIIPGAARVSVAGDRMQQALKEGDAALDGLGTSGKQLKLANDITTAFGSPTNINESILPAATGSERTNLIGTLSQELTTMGQGELGDLSLPYLQKLKTGYAAKAAFGDSNRTAAEKMYGNMANTMKQVISQNAPNYNKAVAEYENAYKSKDFDNNIMGILKKYSQQAFYLGGINYEMGNPIGGLLKASQLTTPPVGGIPFGGENFQ